MIVQVVHLVGDAVEGEEVEEEEVERGVVGVGEVESGLRSLLFCLNL